MKSIVAMSLVVAFACLSFGAAVAAEQSASIQWQTDLEQAVTNARETKKPLLIQLTATWCGYCKKMQRETNEDKEVVQAVNECFVPIMLDADANPEVMKLLKVEGLPTTVVVDTETREASSFRGFRTAKQLRSDLKPFCKK